MAGANSFVSLPGLLNWVCWELKLGSICRDRHKIAQRLLLQYLHPLRCETVPLSLVLGWLTSKNMKARPSPASGAKATKLAISSFEGSIADRVRYFIGYYR